MTEIICEDTVSGGISLSDARSPLRKEFMRCDTDADLFKGR